MSAVGGGGRIDSRWGKPLQTRPLLLDLRRRGGDVDGSVGKGVVVLLHSLAIARLLQKPAANLPHARLALDLRVGAKVSVANDAADALVKVVDRVGHEQPLVARAVRVRLLKVEALVVHAHLAQAKVRVAPDGRLVAGHRAPRQLADGAPRLVRKHVHLAPNHKDARRQQLVVRIKGAEQRVAQLRALRNVRPVDHGRHREHVVGLFGAEAAHCGLVAPETRLFVVRDGEVARGVEGDDRRHDAADRRQLGDGH